MADHNRNPWMPENLPGPYQPGLSLDFAFNPVSGEDGGFLDGLMYNPLAVQNGQGHIEGYAQLGAEDAKPQTNSSGEGTSGPSSWLRGGERVQYEGTRHGGSGNLRFLHQQQLQPVNRREVSAVTATAPADSGTRSQEDEVTAARREMKSNREKLLRDRMNEHFAELAGVLDPGRPPKHDKASILNDGVNVVKKLRDDIAKLQNEHALLLDESKELTAEKNELKEERQQVKTEKETLERRLQGMLSWINFNPSLMMAALANSTQPPVLDGSAAAPNEPPPPQDAPTNSQAEPPSNSVSQQGNTPQGAVQGGAVVEVGQSNGGLLRTMEPGNEGSGAQGEVGARDAVSAASGAQQGGGVGVALISRFGEKQVPLSAADGSHTERGSHRGGSMLHPTRPLAEHFRPAILPPPSQKNPTGLRNLQPKPPGNVPPAQARQPNPPSTRPVAPQQQQKAVRLQTGALRQPPPQQNLRTPLTAATAAPSVSGTTRAGREHKRTDAGGQPAGRQADTARQDAKAARAGHVAAPGPMAAPAAEKSASQATSNVRSEPPRQEAEQPIAQPPPLQQPHPYPTGFAPMPYMGAFPGMMGMHPYSYPPQMAVPNAATPPQENAQQPPPGPYPYHGYGYGQPGNPPGYPYPLFPAGHHPIAYPPFAYAAPYGAPGMGVFAPPPGVQPQPAEPPRPTTVQRPSAKVAQVHLPTEANTAEDGRHGEGTREATPEGGGRTTESFAEPRSEAGPSDARSEKQQGTSARDRRPETVDSQAAKRARVGTSGEESARPDAVAPEATAAAVSDQAQEPSSVASGNQRQQPETSPLGGVQRDRTYVQGVQSSPLGLGSQMSNCSSSSSGSRCGDVWTQSFQSALELPENDPTIRPPAA